MDNVILSVGIYGKILLGIMAKLCPRSLLVTSAHGRVSVRHLGKGFRGIILASGWNRVTTGQQRVSGGLLTGAPLIV